MAQVKCNLWRIVRNREDGDIAIKASLAEPIVCFSFICDRVCVLASVIPHTHIHIYYVGMSLDSGSAGCTVLIQ